MENEYKYVAWVENGKDASEVRLCIRIRLTIGKYARVHFAKPWHLEPFFCDHKRLESDEPPCQDVTKRVSFHQIRAISSVG